MFLVLRQTLYTVQATVFVGGNVGRPMVQYAEDISKESVVDVRGTVVVTPSPVSGCTQKEVELKIEEVCKQSSNLWVVLVGAGVGAVSSIGQAMFENCVVENSQLLLCPWLSCSFTMAGVSAGT